MPAKPSPSLARISKGRAALKLDDGTSADGRVKKGTRANQSRGLAGRDGQAGSQAGRQSSQAQGCVGEEQKREKNRVGAAGREGERGRAFALTLISALALVESRPRYEPSRVISPSREISDISVRGGIISIHRETLGRSIEL